MFGRGKIHADVTIAIDATVSSFFLFNPDKASPRRLPSKRAQKRPVGSDE